MLVAEALMNYSQGLIQNMLVCNRDKDYTTAAAFLTDIKTVADIQFQLVFRLAKVAERNLKNATPGLQRSYEEECTYSQADYLKNYISEDQEGGQDSGN
jgi:hypothetical protein